ncbi:hypothetical protein OAK85_01980 [Mariniblastus sp.]|nr:hypothetical protein [Mariniblastus sp.]
MFGQNLWWQVDFLGCFVAMNSFAHALPFLDDPYFAVGCCIPDWLSACDRKCRARERRASAFAESDDPLIAKVARGVVQHHQDDSWFHQTAAFNQMVVEFSVSLRDVFDDNHSLRPRFFGHVVIELFLDAFLDQKFPGELERFYDQIELVDVACVENAVNLFANRPTNKLVAGIERFRQDRYLFDYRTDPGVAFRIGGVFKRLKLEPFDERILDWMPTARQQVIENAPALLVALKRPF